MYLNQIQIPDKRLDDDLDSDDDALSNISSTIEEIRDDDDKIVRPCQRHRVV
jgi:hypothetical protein